MCVNLTALCNAASHRKAVAVFVLKHISVLNVYVLVTVAGQRKNQVWLTTSATIEKVGAQYESVWKDDPGCSRLIWTELLTQAHIVDAKDSEADSIGKWRVPAKTHLRSSNLGRVW